MSQVFHNILLYFSLFNVKIKMELVKKKKKKKKKKTRARGIIVKYLLRGLINIHLTFLLNETSHTTRLSFVKMMHIMKHTLFDTFP